MNIKVVRLYVNTSSKGVDLISRLVVKVADLDKKAKLTTGEQEKLAKYRQEIMEYTASVRNDMVQIDHNLADTAR